MLDNPLENSVIFQFAMAAMLNCQRDPEGSGLAKIAWPWLFPWQNLSCWIPITWIDVPTGHQIGSKSTVRRA